MGTDGKTPVKAGDGQRQACRHRGESPSERRRL